MTAAGADIRAHLTGLSAIKESKPTSIREKVSDPDFRAARAETFLHD